jgi:Ca2+-binding EF-hand superfamily protein
LSADKAAPFVVNFKLLDVDGNGKITLDEFMNGCKKGLVQENPSKPPTSSGGQTPENPAGK